MIKNNVVKIGDGSRGQRQPLGGGRGSLENEPDVTKVCLQQAQLYSSEIKKEPVLLGWLIYRLDTDEFFHSHKSFDGYSSNAYSLEPSLAYCFQTEQQAFKFSVFIAKPTQIVKLYDFGDKLGVVFS